MEEAVVLNENIMLAWHSVAANCGHFGSCTEYIASERRVVRKKWGARRRFFGLLRPKPIRYEPEYLDIPEGVDTEEELVAYVDKERCGWLTGRRR